MGGVGYRGVTGPRGWGEWDIEESRGLGDGGSGI